MSCGAFQYTIIFPLFFFLFWVLPRYFNITSILILLYLENTFCVNSVPLILCCDLLDGPMCLVLVDVSCVLEKKALSALVEGYVPLMPARSGLVDSVCSSALCFFLFCFCLVFISYWESCIEISDYKCVFFFPVLVLSHFASCILKLLLLGS